MKIGIIGGTAGLGKGLAARLALAGYHVMVGSRDHERASRVASGLREETGRPNIEGMLNESVASIADVVIVSIPFTGIYETASVLKRSLKSDAIVVSPIVPLESEIGGRPLYVELPAGSAAESLREALGSRYKLVSAFTNVPAKQLLDLANPVDCDVIVCGDRSSSEVVMDIASSIPNIKAIYGGELINSRITERMTELLIRLNNIYSTDRIGIRFTKIEKSGK